MNILILVTICLVLFIYLYIDIQESYQERSVTVVAEEQPESINILSKFIAKTPVSMTNLRVLSQTV